MVKTKVKKANELTDEQLVEASLRYVQTSQPFMSSYELDPGYNASIHVTDVGTIDMPLKESQARQLIAKAHPPALHDQGGDIANDASAGKIWELSRSQFDYGGGWPVLMDHVRSVVNPEHYRRFLRPLVSVRVEKMVIYEKGATYKAHTDIEENKGVFATVMISLPSEHEGGDMVFEHGGQKPKRYKSCLETQSFAFWYTGVSHRLTPITSGYRWVLVLKLFDSDGPQRHRPTGLIFPVEVQSVKRAVERWLTTSRESGKHPCLHLLLDWDYLSANGQYCLPGHDFGRTQLLRAACSELPIEVFVGSLEGNARPRGKDIYRIKTLVDLDDHMVARELTLDEKHILDQRRLKEVKGKKRDYERERQCDGKIPPSTIEPLTAFFARSSMRTGASRSVFDTLLHLSGQPEFIEAISGNTLALCLAAFVQFGEFERFEAAVTHHQSTLPLSLFEWLRGWVVASPDKVVERFMNIREGASLALSSCECLADQLKSISRLVPPVSRDSAGEVETPKPMLDWAQEMIRSCLDSMGLGKFGHEAGSLIADVSLYFSDPFTFLEETALPKFRGMSNPLAFHLKLLNRLWNLMVKEGLPEKKYSHLFKETSRWLIETADFAQLSGEKSKAVNQDELEYTVKDVVITNFLVSLINRSTKSDDLVPLFASKIVTDAPRFQATELLTLWMPLLYKVHGKLISDKIPLDTPCYQQLCSALVKSLVDNFVGPEPVDTESQTRGSVSCGCVYCTQLNEFLADSSQSVGTLPIVRTEREHLKDEIKSAGIDCKCEAVPGDSPCTLMTKAPSPQHVENCEAWVNRKKTAYDLLRKVEESHLEQLLGPGYSLFLDLQQEVDPSAAPQPVAVAKAKRKVSDTDIVDLGRGKKKNFKITSFFTKKRAFSNHYEGTRVYHEKYASGSSPYRYIYALLIAKTNKGSK
ncbi:uncharacterized protein NECHADRAFT_84627 [Fusarium vanettenii 77-13-4]|uniref:Fe2OG dioxygenase domain-containing protein n=1 Tax=Fusarium vanettenii (strain ATCC MYA-4622 / CBS 123669 / FGSC 9596 / NRRL 45880 / 77-13-4) TaxID=660122 RepID=C7YTL8_FUSV7|nr:uncharacterized protein NECHADRAFT_84627 [Fusarium vanettenii 77-13-4]EEU44646.1 hypothetical protein NECHADRAFT_84627 [Fusarium vanettenii 77-13-4]